MKNLQVRLPDELKEQADHVFEEMGMDMSTAIRVYLKKVVQTRSIPFSLEAPQDTLERIDVDAETRKKMDAIALAWSKVQP